MRPICLKVENRQLTEFRNHVCVGLLGECDLGLYGCAVQG